MRQANSLGQRIVALALSIMMVLGMLPANAFAVSPSTLTTDIGEKTFVVGQTQEFTFTTTANDDAGAMVLGHFEFSDPTAVEKLEYRESQTGNWYEFYGDFGPAGTGFPMTDATSQFRATFNKAGQYTVKAQMVQVSDAEVLCEVTKNITVARVAAPSTLTSDIDEKTFVVGETQEFTFTTTANDDAGEMVWGRFEFSDPTALEKLEYLEVQSGNWYEFYGDFGPAGTGFPLTDATSRFRATFNQPGQYTVVAKMVPVSGGEALCEVTKTVSVVDTAQLTTNIGQLVFEKNQPTEFTFTTVANADAGKYVLGTFEFSDPTAVAKLEYLEVQSGNWYEFYGDFGPVGTGFPLTNATSRFRVTFNKAGTYAVKASIITAVGRVPLCVTEETVTVAKTASTLSTNIGDISFIVDKNQEFTFTTTANDDAGAMVLGRFEFSDPTAVAKLEYLEVQSGNWYEFYGDFGPVGTGFPLTNATSRFRVTFNKPGQYTVVAKMVQVSDGVELCSVTKTVSVADVAKLTTNIDGLQFTTGETKEFTFTTTANGEAGTMVLGTFQFSDPSAIEKLEYLEVQSGNWYEFYGDFGPVGTGFPLTNATSQFRVTFKKAGTYTLNAAMKAVADGSILCATESTVKVEAAEQTGFAFAEANPTDKWVGETFTNTASGGQTEEKILYEVVEGPATVDENGVVTFTGVGKVTVKATRPGNDFYKAVSEEYVVTSVKTEWTPFGFATSNPKVTYAPGLVYPNAEQTNALTGLDSTVVFEIVSGSDVATIDAATGVLTILKAGDVTVRATRGEDAHYTEATAEYTLTVEKAYQTGFAFENETFELVWQEAPMAQLPLINEKGEGAVTWEVVTGKDVASVDADGKLSLLKAGTFVLRATKLEDDCYHDSEWAYAMVVVKTAPQTGFGFAKDTVDITYNDNGNKYTQKATGGQSGVDPVYSIVSGDAATIDTATGELTILKSGTVEIKAYKAGNEQYSETSDIYTLTIAKDAQDYKLTEEGTIPLTYGTLSYTNEVVVDGFVSQVNKPVYTISANTIGAIINAATGEITFADSEGKVGKVTVTVTVAEDDCYNAFTTSYEIEVGYLSTSAKPTPAGDTLNESGWWTGNLTLVAPEGFTIAYDNELSTQFAASVPVNEDGIQTKTVYLKDADGYITDAITADEVKLDTVDPVELKITYTEPFLEKVLEKITFGIYKNDTAKVSVTVEAQDATSGIASLVYNYGDGDQTVAFNGEKTVSYTFEISAQHRNNISLKATDVAGRTTTMVDNKVLVLDTTIPEITAEYIFETGKNQLIDNIYYTQGDVDVTFTIKEANFDLADAPIVKVNGAEQAVTWTPTADAEKREGKLPTLNADGDYVITVEFKDASTNEMVTYSQEVHIDDVDPEISIALNDNTVVKYENCYKTARTAIVKVVEHNFMPQNVRLTVTAQDIMGNSVDISAKNYSDYAINAENWIYKDTNGDYVTKEADAANADEHYLILPVFDIDAIYQITAEYADKADNEGTKAETAFTIDKTEAQNIQITYSTSVAQEIIEKLTFGFYQAEVTVTVTAEDMTSGVDYFVLTYTRDANASDAHAETFTKTLAARPGADNKTFTASITVSAQARGSFSVVVFDKAGNDAAKADSNTVIVTDTVSPEVEISYVPVEPTTKVYFVDENVQDVNSFAEAANAIYDGDVTAKITVKDSNFFEGKTAGANDEAIVHQVKVRVTKTDDNGDVTVKEYLPADLSWTKDGDVYTTDKVVFTEDGDYVLELIYKDFSQNPADIAGSDGNSGSKTYISKVITVDETNPVIAVSYDNNSAKNENCYKDSRAATITVTEHNFRTSEFVAEITAKDIFGDDVEVKDYAEYAKNPANWTHDGNVHTLKLSFEEDANYTFKGGYTDLAGRAASFEEPDFVVDHTEAQNIKITYSTSVAQEIIEKLTFGFYKADVTVTVTAEDMTSGVDYFVLTYTRDANASDAHTATFTETLAAQSGTDAKTFTASYTVPAQARGSFSVVVYDRAGKTSEAADNTVKVTDTVNPKVTVSYAAAEQGKPMFFVDKELKNQATFANGTNAFCRGDVVTTITVKDSNFFEGKTAGKNDEKIVHLFKLKVTKIDDNGVETFKEYLPADLDWVKNGDTYTTSNVVFNENGDYVLEISYVDFSENPADITGSDGNSGSKDYTSKVITIDKTAPVIDVEYKYENAQSTGDPKTSFGADVAGTPVNETGREYFNENRITVITVTEHNFRADDVVIAVDAKAFYGADQNLTAKYAAQGIDRNVWTKVAADTYELTLVHSEDANYTFDIDYKDLAGNVSEDYALTRFTVDKTIPNKNEAKILFAGFVDGDGKFVDGEKLDQNNPLYYNTYAQIRLEAIDETAGVKYFTYQYKLNADVSGINVGMEAPEILPAQYDEDKNVFYATFTVPAAALELDKNQFNGTIDFTITDRSENESELFDDNTTVIVDSIAPKANISYNAPVRDADGISYYDGNIDVNIAIVEANFDSKDVIVTVTKNGAAHKVNPKWTHESKDKHLGTFTLTQDGDYKVSVSYTDKSGNQMVFESKTGKGTKDYTSNQLTLDTVKPTIQVTNIKNNSANKDETYGFVITADDINLNSETLKPELKAVVKDESGKYVTVDIALGEMTTITEGKTYSFTVDNLPQDGLYTLTCYVEDMSANSTSQIILDDGESYEKVQFSINRDGSVFVYGSEYTASVVDKYYIYSVDEDVVIEEINVDPIENYTVSLNGKELTEGTDYTSEQTSGNGEWSKRIYTISKSLFAAQGEYAIIVSSTDKTETTAYSDIKDLTLRFVVDQNKPALTITGLATGGRYQTDLQKVTLSPTDHGGRLNSLTVIVLDSDGNPLKDKKTGKDISLRFKMEGEDLLKHLEENGGMITFTIPQGLNNKVQIICNDCAINAQNLTNEYNELFEKVTVSPNGLVIFYANTPAFIGTIAGVLALVALIIFLIKRKGAKKAAK